MKTRPHGKRSAAPRRKRKGGALPPGIEEPSDASTTRLSLYLRILARWEAEARDVISSEELALSSGVKPALVRKDLTQFGQFGTRGVGYEVRHLRTNIQRILGVDREHGVIILGAGNLGMALADSRGFNTGGFRTLALFDRDRRKIGRRSRKKVPVLAVRELKGFVRRHGVEIAVLAVPESAAQRVIDGAARAGIRAVLNFVPAVLRQPRGLHVRSVDLKIHLESLTCRLARQQARRGSGSVANRAARRR